MRVIAKVFRSITKVKYKYNFYVQMDSSGINECQTKMVVLLARVSIPTFHNY